MLLRTQNQELSFITMSNFSCFQCGGVIQQSVWLLFLNCDLETRNYCVMKGEDLSVASFQSVIHHADAVVIDPLQSYVCNEMKAVANEFQHIAPQFEHHIRRALRECVFLKGIFGFQRLRFVVFEYFAKFATRQLVAEAVMRHDDWYRHDEVYTMEERVLGDWYEWFEDTGAFIGIEVGFTGETRLHFRELRDIVRRRFQ